MFHKGVRTSSGDLSGDYLGKVQGILDQFTGILSKKVEEKRIKRAVVRSMLTCSTIAVLDSQHLFVAAEKQTGMPSSISLDHRSKIFTLQEIYEAAKWEFGFDNPFVIQFPVVFLDQNDEERQPALEAITETHIQSELNRVQREMNIIQVNPIFDPPSYAIDQRLAFILMPFQKDLTEIYNTFIKPTVELDDFGLVCKRADDIKSNKVIIQDIWKSICEARVIIADLSGLNANVMYELGIAHTLGKDTILIYQKGGDVKFPFDLSHIRRIEYENSALGGKRLEQELRDTLSNLLGTSIKA